MTGGRASSMETLVVDNGGGYIKAGIGGEAAPRIVMPNVEARKDRRKLLGDELLTATDRAGLVYHRPFVRGLLLNWELEVSIWDRMLKLDCLKVRCCVAS